MTQQQEQSRIRFVLVDFTGDPAAMRTVIEAFQSAVNGQAPQLTGAPTKQEPLPPALPAPTAVATSAPPSGLKKKPREPRMPKTGNRLEAAEANRLAAAKFLLHHSGPASFADLIDATGIKSPYSLVKHHWFASPGRGQIALSQAGEDAAEAAEKDE